VSAPDRQSELFDLAEIEGYAALGARERLFAQGIFEGLTQTAAARRAGVSGSDEYIQKAACKLVRKGKVQRLLSQAWTRSGADIHETLRQAAELQKQAVGEVRTSANQPDRDKAFRRWLGASTLIAHIHGRMNLNVSGHFTFSVVSDEDRAHLRELAAAGVPVSMPDRGGRN